MLKAAGMFLAASLVFASGCATKYQSASFTGGFKDTQLAPDVFRVSFSGNARTSPGRVQDFALLRAAELCIAGGFPYFAVVESRDQSRAQRYVTPGSAQTTGTLSGYGNTAYYSGTTTYSPAQVNTMHKPGVGLVVQGFKEKPENIFSYDAEFLANSIRTKYKIKQKDAEGR